MNSIVSYYYFWKTTDRYQIQKRHRMIEKQNDLKEVIVHLRSNGPPTAPRDLSGRAATSGSTHNSVPNNISSGPPPAADGKGCESCFGEQNDVSLVSFLHYTSNHYSYPCLSTTLPL